MLISINWGKLFWTIFKIFVVGFTSWFMAQLGAIIIGIVVGGVVLGIIVSIFGGFFKTAIDKFPSLLLLPAIAIGAFLFQNWDKIAPILGLTP